MFENPEALNRIKSMYSFATAVAKNHQILMLTSNDNRTTNISDYTGNSVKAEFFSDEDEALISKALKSLGFSVKHFYNEDDFIKYIIKMSSQNLSEYIVLSSAQKGTKIGRKSLIPLFCDLYNVKYIGSNPYVVSLCRDKYRTSCILKENQINTPHSWMYDIRYGWIGSSPEGYPNQLIIKPNYEASSIGISEENIGYFDAEFFEKVKNLSKSYHQEVLVEEFIEGYEVEVPVICDGDPFCVFPAGISLNTKDFLGTQILNYNIRYHDAYSFYDFSNKNLQLANRIMECTCKVAKLLNISGLGRIDFRIDANQNIYITDISTNPHYTLHSSYFYVFQQLGLNYEDLIACLIASSLMNNTRNKK